jgi:hypothetical protein
VQEAEKADEPQAAPPAAPAKPDAKPAGNEQKNVRNAYDIAPLVPPKLDTYA